ncbi:MAG TPA: glutamyl-tRNA reductase [Gammaproteobacteria bacterium]|nr:glutamyl-tRNA reductase [Gammaproteobacteria bacterium]
MPLSIFGINHHSAPVSLREHMAFSEAELPAALRGLRATGGVLEAAILSTCNRTELYCVVDSTDNAAPIEWLLAHHGAVAQDLRPFLYHHPETGAVRHLLRVACGLDSMVLGEPQILGQLKTAYQAAAESGTVGRILNKLFQHSFHVAKKVRTDTAIGNSPVSVAFAAVRLAQQIHGDLRACTALLIGAGDTIELTAHHLTRQRLGRLLIANRTLERAQGLASRFGGYAMPLADLPRHLAEADIVISSTAARLPVLSRTTVAAALQARRHRPMFLVDLAVPRDIEPAVSGLEDVYLYTIDNLQSVITDNLRSRQAAALQAQEIIDLEAHRFLEWTQQHDAVELLRQLRGRAESVRDELLVKAQQQLQQGVPAADVLQQLAGALTNRLLHAPTVMLKDAGIDGRDDLLRAAAELFDLAPKPGNGGNSG